MKGKRISHQLLYQRKTWSSEINRSKRSYNV